MRSGYLRHNSTHGSIADPRQTQYGQGPTVWPGDEFSSECSSQTDSPWLELRLPRRWRRWLLLAMAAVMLVVVAWTFRAFLQAQSLQHRLDRLRHSGQPTSWEQLDAAYQAVPDRHNFGLHVLAVADALDEPMPETEPWARWRTLPDSYQQISPTYIDQARDYLHRHAAAVSAMLRDNGFSGSRYPIDLSTPFGTKGNHLRRVERVCWLLTMQTLVAIHDGQSAKGVDSLLAMARVADSLRHEPLVTSYLMRLKIIDQAAWLSSVAARRLPLSQAQTAQLTAMCCDSLDREQLKKLIVAERLERLDLPDAGAAIDSRSELMTFTSRPGDDRLACSYVDMTMSYINTLDTASDAELIAELTAIDQAWLASLDPQQRLWYDMRHHTRAAEFQMISVARLRCAAVSLAAAWRQRATGAPPAHFDDLAEVLPTEATIDPYTDQSLRAPWVAGCVRGGSGGYSAGYAIYSVGVDRTDDGGAPGAVYEPGTDIGLLAAR